MIKKLIAYRFYLFCLLIVLVFYWKIIFTGQVAFPGDLLVGGYYPWLNNRWGYAVGVPIKNAVLSDVFSQFYVWKLLISDSYRSLHFPLWNSYSYSGYPLLANFHSGALNPANLFMVLFRGATGWNLMIVFQTLGMLTSMGVYLRSKGRSSSASLAGSVTYAFSGFAITWSQFMTAGYAMVWFPLMFYFVDRYFQSMRAYYLLFIAPLVFLVVSAGHFQSLIFGLLFVSVYFSWRSVFVGERLLKNMVLFVSVMLVGVGLSAMQLLPTLEQFGRSIRLQENYVSNYNFGLLPTQNLLTLFAPDFFGNPTTGNYWGFFNYHETVLYAGVVVVLAMVTALYRVRRLGEDLFFLIGALTSLLLVFDNFAGRFVYVHSIPFVSTAVAGRVIVVFVLSAGVMVSWWVDAVPKFRLSDIVRYYWWVGLGALLLVGITFVTRTLFLSHADILSVEIANVTVAFRNLFFPLLILRATLFAVTFFRKKSYFGLIIILIILFDLFRFGWKYTPFVPSGFVFAREEPLSFLENQPGHFRVERERGGIIPPNTWAAYGLNSVSGYDPLASAPYVSFYEETINRADGRYSRYSELEAYDARLLGDLGVKYLVGLRWSKEGEIVSEGEGHNYRINTDDWEPVRWDGGTVLFENKYFKPIVRFEDGGGALELTAFRPGFVEASFDANRSQDIIILENAHPGWKAYIDGDETEVQSYGGVFKSVHVDAGEAVLRLRYAPDSFVTGLRISLLSFLLWLILVRTTSRRPFYRA